MKNTDTMKDPGEAELNRENIGEQIFADKCFPHIQTIADSVIDMNNYVPDIYLDVPVPYAVYEVLFNEDESEVINTRQKEVKENSIVNIALGFSWTDNSQEIKDTIRQADKAMYQDKARYYKDHDRRRK